MKSELDNSRPTSFRQTLHFVIGILVVGGIALALSSSVLRPTSQKTSRPADTILPASIRPHTMATISSMFPGQIATMHVSAGTKVKAGDPLMTLANSEFVIEHERAKSRFEDVQQTLNNRARSIGETRTLESQSQSAIRTLEAAKERLAGFSLNEVQTAYEMANARVRELEKLMQRQVATDTELEEARKVKDVAMRNVRAEREHLSRLKEELAAAQGRVDDAQRLWAPSRADDVHLKMALREAAEALRIADKRRDSQNIRSTISGTVLRTMVNTGDEIPSGVPLLQIGELDQLDFDVPVGADLALKFKVGQKVNVRMPTEPPTRISAPISAILLVPVQDHSAYTIRISIKNPSPSAVLVGLAGEVEFPHLENQWRVFPF